MKMTVLEFLVVVLLFAAAIGLTDFMADRAGRQRAFRDIVDGRVMLVVSTNVVVATNMTYVVRGNL